VAANEPEGGADSRRRIGLASASALVVASMVGAGVFTTSGFALADLGSLGGVLWAWGLGGITAGCGALCYGALARAIPESGGEYTFLARTLHPLAGFLAGWISLVAGFTVPIAVAALGLQAYLASTFAIWGDPRFVGTGAILLAAFLHGLRLRPGLWAQNAAVGLKLCLIMAFVAIGTWRLLERPDEPIPPGVIMAPGAPPLGAFAVSLVWISFAYSGWNAAVYVAGEVRDPERNLPRALLAGCALVTLLYLALNAVFVHAAAPAELAGEIEVGAIAAEALGGPSLRRLLALIVALALFTSVSSLVMSGPRVYARMAQDDVFPRFFACEGEVPERAIALQAALAIAVVWSAGLRELLTYAGFTLGLCAAATVLGLVRLRLSEGAARVPVPGWPLTPAVHVGMTLFASIYLVLREPRGALLGAATVAAGLLLRVMLVRAGGGRTGAGP
jgi:APA family basic amino acid/polyamine antiporter